ncbi:hypothetical protein BAS06_15855 [Elizabethkingia miricola]|nr:hypothetical protein BAS06_15855 [Elizabethkingia miricola]PSL86717.1 hypothetical protein C7V10_19225 [Elizabethkingia miricola]
MFCREGDSIIFQKGFLSGMEKIGFFFDDLILGLLGATRNYYELMKLNINVLFHKKYINKY